MEAFLFILLFSAIISMVAWCFSLKQKNKQLMFKVYRLRDEYNYLDEKLEQVRFDNWCINNPPDYKPGDKVIAIIDGHQYEVTVVGPTQQFIKRGLDNRCEIKRWCLVQTEYPLRYSSRDNIIKTVSVPEELIFSYKNIKKA